MSPDQAVENKNITVDEIRDKRQDEIILGLQAELAAIKKDTVELSERRRGWVRSGITFWFCALITYVVIKYTGGAEGQIKPETIWSFGTGVLVTKILDHYINSVTKNDRVL